MKYTNIICASCRSPLDDCQACERAGYFPLRCSGPCMHSHNEQPHRAMEVFAGAHLQGGPASPDPHLAGRPATAFFAEDAPVTEEALSGLLCDDRTRRALARMADALISGAAGLIPSMEPIRRRDPAAGNRARSADSGPTTVVVTRSARGRDAAVG